MTDPSHDQRDKEDDKPHGKNAVEWSVFAFSAVLVTLVLSYLGYLSLTVKQTPPELSVRLGELTQRDGQIWVPVTVENRGTATASNVQVEVEAKNGSSASFTLPYVPRHGERHGWVGFEPPLTRHELKARVSGYEAP